VTLGPLLTIHKKECTLTECITYKYIFTIVLECVHARLYISTETFFDWQHFYSAQRQICGTVITEYCLLVMCRRDQLIITKQNFPR